MSPQEFIATLRRLHFASTTDFAIYVGTSRQSAWRWAQGIAPIPFWALCLLSMLEENQQLMKDIRPIR